MENCKPLYSEDFLCPVCDSADTVCLYIPGDEKPDFVLWCAEGHVSVRSEGKKRHLFSFRMEVKD
jgi:hypothetical protein